MTAPPLRVTNAGPERAALSARGSLVSAMLGSARLRVGQALVGNFERLDRELVLAGVELGHRPLRRPAAVKLPLRLGDERGVELDDRARQPAELALDPLLAPLDERARRREALLQHDIRPLRRAGKLKRRVVHAAFLHRHDFGLVGQAAAAFEERLAARAPLNLKPK